MAETTSSVSARYLTTPVKKYVISAEKTCLVCNKNNGQIQNLLATKIGEKSAVDIVRKVLNLHEEITCGCICVNCVQRLKTIENKTKDMLKLYERSLTLRIKRTLCTPTKRSPQSKRQHPYNPNQMQEMSDATDSNVMNLCLSTFDKGHSTNGNVNKLDLSMFNNKSDITVCQCFCLMCISFPNALIWYEIWYCSAASSSNGRVAKRSLAMNEVNTNDEIKETGRLQHLHKTC